MEQAPDGGEGEEETYSTDKNEKVRYLPYSIIVNQIVWELYPWKISSPPIRRTRYFREPELFREFWFIIN